MRRPDERRRIWHRLMPRRYPAKRRVNCPLTFNLWVRYRRIFIVAVNSEGLWIIDQHAAHERVLFDHHVRRRRERNVEGQRLLMPIVLELKPEQQVVFQVIADELVANGFEVEPFGQRTVAIKTAPAEIPANDVDKLLLEVLESASQGAAALSLEDLPGNIAASISCHAAIKINMALDFDKMDWLLQALGKTDCPMTCPHGRPTVLRYGMKVSRESVQTHLGISKLGAGSHSQRFPDCGLLLPSTTFESPRCGPRGRLEKCPQSERL